MHAPGADSDVARLRKERQFAQQQIDATAEALLRVISSSLSELSPVFDAILPRMWCIVKERRTTENFFTRLGIDGVIQGN